MLFANLPKFKLSFFFSILLFLILLDKQKSMSSKVSEIYGKEKKYVDPELSK